MLKRCFTQGRHHGTVGDKSTGGTDFQRSTLPCGVGLEGGPETRVFYCGWAFISGFKANVRDRDSQVLGVVSDRYKVVQNEDAFAFTDELLGEGVTYETAGSLQNGRRTWILAKLPQRYIIRGDEIDPYLVFMNSHDGSRGY